ncbi:hypothetical protein AKO1_007989 [Acrasis kona]|uniref:Uncharacterized protein n=1 Tax=Acrasis kona TaxID=1008807 RepID=A0AAW2YQC5_9EUKA
MQHIGDVVKGGYDYLLYYDSINLPNQDDDIILARDLYDRDLELCSRHIRIVAHHFNIKIGPASGPLGEVIYHVLDLSTPVQRKTLESLLLKRELNQENNVRKSQQQKLTISTEGSQDGSSHSDKQKTTINTS